MLDLCFLLYYNVCMKNIVREPRQERSIEKKNRIIQAGYELFSEVGYYGTNTAEIAKRANVSTGIVYGYFQDKRDILISVLQIYISKVFEPILKLFDKLSPPIDYCSLMPNIIDLIIKTHKKHAKMHEVLHSLSSTDEVVNSEFLAFEDSITTKIANKLIDIGEDKENIMEKVHFAMNIIQSFAHEYVFDKHEYIDYFAMREMVVSTLITLFKN